MRIEEHGDLRVQFLDADGPLISSAEDATDLIGGTLGRRTSRSSRCRSPGSIRRSSTCARAVAGEITQKFVNYQLKLAVIGDVSAAAAASQPLADYIWETNRGDHIWFFDDEAGLVEKLAGRTGR